MEAVVDASSEMQSQPSHSESIDEGTCSPVKDELGVERMAEENQVEAPLPERKRQRSAVSVSREKKSIVFPLVSHRPL